MRISELTSASHVTTLDSANRLVVDDPSWAGAKYIQYSELLTQLQAAGATLLKPTGVLDNGSRCTGTADTAPNVVPICNSSGVVIGYVPMWNPP